MERICATCRRMLPETDYYFRKAGKYGDCKTCFNAKGREYRKARREAEGRVVGDRTEKNRVRLDGDVAYVELRNVKRELVAEAIIDAEDLARVLASPYRWYPVWHRQTAQYLAASRDVAVRGLSLHRFITDAQPGEVVDHLNHVQIDCRKSNLRRCSSLVNNHNRKGPNRDNTSGALNVYWVKRAKCWIVKIKIREKCRHFGSFRDFETAASVAAEARRNVMLELTSP